MDFEISDVVRENFFEEEIARLPEKRVIDDWCNALIRKGMIAKIEGDARVALWLMYVRALKLDALLRATEESERHLTTALGACLKAGLKSKNLNKLIQTKRSWYVASRVAEVGLTPLSVRRLLDSLNTEDQEG